MTRWLTQLDPNIVVLALIGLLAVIVIAVFGRKLSVHVGNVHAELSPNGGSTMRDAVDRIEAKADDALERIVKLEAAEPKVATAIVVQSPAAVEQAR